MVRPLFNINRNFKLSKTEILLCFIILFPISDILTGFMIFRLGMPESFIGSPSQIIRLGFLAVGLTQLPKQSFLSCLKLILWLLFIESFSFFFITNITPFISGVNYSFKLVYIYIFYLWVNCLGEKNKKFYYQFNKAILYSGILYAFIGIIIPVCLGLSKGSYGEGTFGQKGLISSGNAMGIYLGIITSIYTLKKNKDIKEKLCIIILYSSLILLATKTALLFAILVLFINLKNFNKYTAFLLMSGCIFFCIYYIDVIINTFNIIADVIIFRFEKSESIFSFLMSSRDGYVVDAFTEFFKSDWWPIKALIGGGAFMSFRSDFYPGMVFDTLENEFFDIFFMYGIIGLITYIRIIFIFVYQIFRKNKLLSFLFLLFSLHSIFAGHILFDGIPIMAGLLIIQLSKNIKRTKMLYNI